MGILILVHPFLLHILEKSGIIKMQKSIVFKTLFQILIGVRHSKTESENRKILMGTLMNIFANFIPHKTCKLDYKTLRWMNKSNCEGSPSPDH